MVKKTGRESKGRQIFRRIVRKGKEEIVRDSGALGLGSCRGMGRGDFQSYPPSRASCRLDTGCRLTGLKYDER